MKTFKLMITLLLPGISFAAKSVPLVNQNNHVYSVTAFHMIADSSYDGSIFFSLKLKNGEQIGNIFSRAIAYWGNDFKDKVSRVSGTATYTVIDNDPLKPIFASTYNYDGMGKGGGKVQITDNGSKTNKVGSKESRVYSDGSGIMYNALVWGEAPRKIYKGETWDVNISIPWELGGPGKQTVRVLQVDPENHTVTLEREGTSEGFYADDAKELDIKKNDSTLHVKLSPGKSHWKGYTIIKDGLIVSDELMVIRLVEMTNGDQKFNATEREYFLLNQMPVFEE
jgi:hypothetical protein